MFYHFTSKMFNVYTYNALFIFAFCNGMSNFGQIIGPADFAFQLIEDCSNVDETKEIDFSFTQRKYNRSMHVLDIGIETKYDLDDKIIIDLKSYVKRNGKYTPDMFNLRKPMCDALKKMLGDIFFALLKATADVDDCPLPHGSYSAKDYYMDNTKFMVPQMYGEYKMEVNIYKDEDLIRCLNLYYELEPKEI